MTLVAMALQGSPPDGAAASGNTLAKGAWGMVVVMVVVVAMPAALGVCGKAGRLEEQRRLFVDGGALLATEVSVKLGL